jgi:orotidine-5'-phosphate decarboxylase
VGSGKPGATAGPSFQQRLLRAQQGAHSLLCVGLDPDLARFPASLRNGKDVAEAIVAFNTGVIAATSDLASVFKPNLGFYLAHGEAGISALVETRRLVPRHIPVLLDAKVGDIGITAEGYAAGYFDAWGFDAVTVNPYLGEDSLEPFLRRPDKGVIVVCKTSNPGSGDLQDLSTRMGDRDQALFLTVAERVRAWSERWPASLGLVVGATYPTELEAVRRRAPDLPILLPGVGAQAGDLEASLRAGLDATGGGLMVSASRAILYPPVSDDADWTVPVRAAAIELRDRINAARPARVGA